MGRRTSPNADKRQLKPRSYRRSSAAHLYFFTSSAVLNKQNTNRRLFVNRLHCSRQQLSDRERSNLARPPSLLRKRNRIRQDDFLQRRILHSLHYPPGKH